MDTVQNESPVQERKLKDGYSFQIVWQQVSPELEQELRDMWKAEVNMPDATIKERIPQAAIIARNPEGALAAVATIWKAPVPILSGEICYHLRVMVASAERQSHIASLMTRELRDYLEAKFVSGEDTSVIGLYTETENEYLKKFRNDAVWPTSKMVFIGTNAKANHLRIYYFDGATVGANAPTLN